MLYSGIFIRAACSVLRAPCKCESNKGIHSFNFSSVLRAACKYELAFKVDFKTKFQLLIKLTKSVRHTVSTQQLYDYPNNYSPNRGVQLARSQLFNLITFTINVLIVIVMY